MADVWKQFVDICTVHMNDPDLSIVEQSVSLLLKFLNYFDGKTDENEDFFNVGNPSYTIKIRDEDENIEREF
jgi:hypothetical protein